MKILRRTLDQLNRLFHDDGLGGAGGGGSPAAGADAGGTGTPPAFDIRQHVDDAGAFKPDWHKAAGVSEALAKKFTRPEALARSYETLEAQIGKKGIIQPGPNATQAERDAYYTALGRPAKPEEYSFVKPDKIKVWDKEMAVPDHAWDANRAKAWQTRLHAMGVPKDTAQAIMAAAVEESVTGLDMIAQAGEQAKGQAKAALQKEWGAEFETNMKAAARAAKEFGGDDLMNHPGLANDPIMIRTLAKMGAAIAEKPGINQRQQGGQNQPTAAEANAQAHALAKKIIDLTKADRQWANSPEAAQMRAEKTRLFQLANPA